MILKLIKSQWGRGKSGVCESIPQGRKSVCTCSSLHVCQCCGDAWIPQLSAWTKREKVTGAGFLSYLLGSECCNHPSLFSWIASQAYKQHRDTADRPVRSGLLHRPDRVLPGHGERWTHSHRPQTQPESPWKPDCPCPRFLMEAWVHILHNCPYTSQSLYGETRL